MLEAWSYAEREPVIIERGRKDNRAGMPRPLARNKGTLRPVPWTNADDWGILNDTRSMLCEKNSRCLVCGMDVEKGKILTTSDNCPVNATQADLYDHAADRGPLHDRCAKMTVAHCAKVRHDVLHGTMRIIPYCRQEP